MAPLNGERRCFLFLQGPHGSFFPRVGHGLAESGHGVRRINLNGGDHATWPGGDAYHGRERHWSGFIARYLARYQITDLAVFGDSRPAHTKAILAAHEAGVRVHVFEEGYIRPDWITLERDGVNGHSKMPRDPNWYVRTAADLPPLPEYASLPSYYTARGWAAFFYYAEVALNHWRFPFHRSHRDRDPILEGFSFLRRWPHRARERRLSAAGLARIAGKPFFLFPLQLNSDYQIRLHSPFGTVHRGIEVVLESFARACPADTYLVIKEHPLDSGLNGWRDGVARRAAALEVEDRVVFIEQGDLPALVDASRGMVVVNSTSGTLALAAKRPVKALGSPVYDMPGLTDQQPLDGFWANPMAADPAVYDAFYRVLAHERLIRGAFLSNTGAEQMVAEAIVRLTGSS